MKAKKEEPLENIIRQRLDIELFVVISTKGKKLELFTDLDFTPANAALVLKMIEAAKPLLVARMHEN
jgi:hypothetical protein